MEKWEAEMGRIEETIRKSDGDGLRARWESGRYMLTLRQGKKQLPPGMLDAITTKYDVSRAELTARMKFAMKFATEEKLTNAVRKFRTWHEIVQRGLTTTPRAPKTPARAKTPTIIADGAVAANVGETGGANQQTAVPEDAGSIAERVKAADTTPQLRRVRALLAGLDRATRKGDPELLAEIAQHVRRLQFGFVITPSVFVAKESATSAGETL